MVRINRLVPVLLGVIALILTYYLTDLFLERNFAYEGEAYSKGSGHLLAEDLKNGMLFLITRHLLVSTLLFFLLFRLIDFEGRRSLYRTLRRGAVAVLTVVLIYVLFQVGNLREGSVSEERVIEIVLTWTLRILGFFLGYWIARISLTPTRVRTIDGRRNV